MIIVTGNDKIKYYMKYIRYTSKLGYKKFINNGEEILKKKYLMYPN